MRYLKLLINIHNLLQAPEGLGNPHMAAGPHTEAVEAAAAQGIQAEGARLDTPVVGDREEDPVPNRLGTVLRHRMGVGGSRRGAAGCRKDPGGRRMGPGSSAEGREPGRCFGMDWGLGVLRERSTGWGSGNHIAGRRGAVMGIQEVVGSSSG